MSDRSGMPASYDDDISREPEIVHTSQSACPVCGCTPGDPWGCDCDNPDCPCSEREDGGDDD